MHEDETYTTLYRDVMPSVVSIYVDEPASGRPRSGSGSGFVYDDEGHVVTNQHVVAPPDVRGGRRHDGRRRRDRPEAVDEVELRFSRGDWRTAELVGADVHTDLAVVRAADLPEYARPLPVAAESPEPGRPVAALGNPMGLDGSITSGIVSGTNRSMATGGGFALPDTVQTDAPINPGNSGGPLVTTDGTVVGVNRARQGDNIGFAISPEIIERVVSSLVADGEHRHPYLRVRTVDVSPSVAEANDLPAARGTLVVDVRLGPSSAALLECTGTVELRGREVPVGGDVIVGIDDQPVDAHEELMRHLVVECSPGDEVSLTVLRDGEERTVSIELAERPEPGRNIPAS